MMYRHIFRKKTHRSVSVADPVPWPGGGGGGGGRAGLTLGQLGV